MNRALLGVVLLAACGGKSDSFPPGVVCWGELASDRTEAPHLVAGFEGATQLALTDEATCATTPSGMRCVGDLDDGNGPGDAVRALPVPDARALAAGSRFTCALRASGAVACWGDNLVGELGNGRAPDPNTRIAIPTDGTSPDTSGIGGARSDTPVAVAGVTDAIAIAAGSGHVCAIRKGGAVVCWGSNTVSALGIPDVHTTDHPLPVAGVSGAVAIAAGRHATCVITGGSVMCWGQLVTQNETGGIGAPTWATPTTIAGISTAAELAVDEAEACARLTSGAIRCWGPDRKVISRELAPAVQLTGGFRHMCARLAGGQVACWGDNLNGQLGQDHGGPVVIVPQVEHATAAVVGGSHSCAVIGAS